MKIYPEIEKKYLELEPTFWSYKKWNELILIKDKLLGYGWISKSNEQFLAIGLSSEIVEKEEKVILKNSRQTLNIYYNR